MPILILGHTRMNIPPRSLKNGITQTVTCLAKALEYLRRGGKAWRTLKIHIKLDTGMSRLGFLVDGAHFDEGVDTYHPLLRSAGA